MTSHPHLRSSANGAAAAAAAVVVDGLPPLETLVTWVHRPCAIAKCHISDIYSIKALVHTSQQNLSYASRDVFLLGQIPCKMVQIVAWVSGVDHKEASMTVTLDDGSDHVLPVLVRLTLIKPPKPLNTSRTTGTGTKQSTGTAAARTSFASVKDRLAKRQVAEAEKAKAGFIPTGKVYDRKDVRVGDTVKIIGKVDEWLRKKSTGDAEWVRQVVVEEGAGGSIVVVDPDMQYLHTAQVHDLYQSTYSKPFSIPDFVPKSQPPTPTKSLPLRYNYSTSNGNGSVGGYGRTYGDSIESSEAPSELTIAAEGDEPELRDPDRLRSSQLTDRTFRHYMLDRMTQETIRSLRDIAAQGPEATRSALEMYFPEYKSSIKEKGKGKGNATTSKSGVFAPSTRHNSLPLSDDQNTPRRASFASRKSIIPQIHNTLQADVRLKASTVASILKDDRLSRLARLVVDNELRKEEKRRRRRIRDGQATKKDLSIENERKINGIGVGKDYLDSITESEKWTKMERLVKWVIRGVAQEGSLIQVRLPTSDREYGYLPIPPQLLYPLLVPHLEAEGILRKSTIRRKGDPKTGNGMTVDELCIKLRCWGEDGRWEKVGDWNIEAALEWAGERGLTKREGRGWWVDDVA